MKDSQRALDSLAFVRFEEMSSGDGYDFMAKELQSTVGKIDLLLYSRENRAVKLWAVADNSVEQKRAETECWTELFQDKGFSNIRRRITSEDYLSGLEEVQTFPKGYAYRQELDEQQKSYIRSEMAEIFPRDVLHDSAKELDQKILKEDYRDENYGGFWKRIL